MMKAAFADNRKFLLRFITSYSILLVIMLLMGLYMYQFGLNDVKSNLHEQGMSTLVRSIDNMDTTLQVMSTFGSQTMGNSSILRLLSAASSDGSSFYVSAAKAQRFLKFFLLSEEILPISDYFIYLPYTDYLLSSTMFNDSDLYYRLLKAYDVNYYEDWLSLLRDKSNYRTFHSMDNFTGKHGASFYYILPVSSYAFSQDSPGAICFEVDYKQLSDLFANLPLYDTGFLYVTDSAGKPAFLIPGEDTASLTEETLSNISSVKPDSGQYAVIHLNGQSMLVTAAVSSYNDWHYYLIQPADMIMSGLISYQKTYLAIIGITCLISFLLILFLSKRNVEPIIQMHSQLENTLKEHSSLQDTLEAQKPIICRSYAERIMTGRVSNQDEMDYITSYLNICTENRKFCVFYLSIYFDQPENFIASDNSETAARPDYSEILRNKFLTYFPSCVLIYEASSREYALLLSSEQDEALTISLPMFKEQFLALRQDLIDSYSVWIFGGLGNRNADLMYTWKSYQQAIEASGYTGKDNYFQAYKDISKTNSSYYYPLEFAQKLTGFITAGSSKQVAELMKLIYHENYEERSLSLPMLKWFISDIRNTLLKIRFTIQDSDSRHLELVSIDEKLNTDSNFQTISEAALLLTVMFEHKPEGNKLISAIQQYIRENFSDASLCLTKISDTFDISESYFSYLFKAETGENFSEYLERIRMEQAMYLLTSTDTGISNLYLEVGYNNANSFRRAFKKVHGVSPRAARESFMEGNSN